MPMNATNEHKWNECHIHFMEETNFHDTATFHLLCSHNKGQINSFYIDVHMNAPTKMKNTLTAFGTLHFSFLTILFFMSIPNLPPWSWTYTCCYQKSSSWQYNMEIQFWEMKRI